MDARFSFILILAGIALGYLLKKAGVLGKQDGRTLTRITLNVTLPAVVLRTFLTTPFQVENLLLPVLLLVMGGVMFFLGKWTSGGFKENRNLYRISLLGTNIGLFAYPIIELLYGRQALGPAVYMDFGNAMVLFALSYGYCEFHSKAGEHGGGEAIKHVFKRVFTFIPFLAYLVALPLSIFSVQLPPLAMNFLDILARGNTLLVFLLLGVLLEFNFTRDDWKFLIRVLGLRLLVGLVFGLTAYFFLPRDEMIRRIALIIFLLPPAVSVIAYSIEFDYNEELAAKVLNLGNIISILILLAISFLPAL